MSILFLKIFNQICLKTDQICQSRFFKRFFDIMAKILKKELTSFLRA